MNLRKSSQNCEVMQSSKNEEMGSFKALTRNFPFSVGFISWAIIFIDCKENYFYKYV